MSGRLTTDNTILSILQRLQTAFEAVGAVQSIASSPAMQSIALAGDFCGFNERTAQHPNSARSGGMESTHTIWIQFFSVAATYGVLLAVVISPALVLAYRRRVSRWMDSPSAGAVSQEDPSADLPLSRVVWQVLKLDSVMPEARAAWRLYRTRVERRTLAGWASGGLANAGVMTLLLLLAFPEYASPSIALTGLTTFALPAMATALYLSDLGGKARVALFIALSLTLYLLLGYRADLALMLFVGFVLLPVALLALLSLRLWRGVVPLVVPLALVAGGLAVVAVEFARQWFAVEPENLWIWRVSGLLLGAVLGIVLLRQIQAGYERRWLSDQEIFLDAWWLLYVLIQTVILVMMKRDAFFFVALLGWPLAIGVRRIVWYMLPAPESAGTPRHLLLLRVFDDDGHAHRLLDVVERRWRSLGSVRMIAGRDLALRNLDPADMVAFVSGRLKRRFVGSGEPLAERLRSLSDKPDLDGRYRMEHFWCHADEWQPVMRELAKRSHVVLMDLRGFALKREGSRYELQHLARTAADRRVVLLVDSDAQQHALRELLAADDSAASNWRLVALGPAGIDNSDGLFDLLAGPAGVSAGG